MKTKFIFSKNLKKIITMVLMVVVTLSLTSCNAANRNPYGSIDLNKNYASVKVGNDTFAVTNQEIYDSIRFSTLDYFEKKVNEAIYAEEIATVKADLAAYEEKFVELILKDIYETSDLDEINDKSAADIKKANAKYVDKMHQASAEYKSLTTDDIANDVAALASDNTTLEFKVLYPYYYLEVAKYVAAKNKLTEAVKKVNDKVGADDYENQYYTKDKIIDYFDDNMANKGDTNILLIKFISTDEVTKLLTKFGIKAYDGEWYQIKISDEKKAELTTEAKYETYYTDYSISSSTNGDSAITLIGNGNATILKLMVELYNFLYPYRTEINYAGRKTFTGSTTDPLAYYNYAKSIIDADHELVANSTEENDLAKADATALYNALMNKNADGTDASTTYPTLYTNEDLNKISSSLATYVYETLMTESEAKDAENDTYTQYSATYRTYDSSYYFVFKLNAEKGNELYKTEEDADGNDTTVFVENSEAIIKEIQDALFEADITDSYITECYNERIEDVKIKIYDSTLELNFMYQSESKLKDKYNKTKTKNNNLLGKVKYNKKWTEITVNDCWNELEPVSGPQAALSLLFTKYIKTTDYYKNLGDKTENYKTSIENMLYYFSNGYYSSYGYDSAMGKYNFMKLYFGSANLNEAIDSLRVSAAKSAYYNDLSDDLLTKFLGYANGSRDAYYSLTATHVLVYADLNDDGTPDEGWTSNATLKTAANELLSDIINYVKNSQETYATAIANVISEYNGTLRITSTNPTSSEYKWTKYRRLGLQVSSADLSEITNSDTTNEESIVNRIKDLYENGDVLMPAYGFTSAILDDTQVLETTDGLNMLLITAGSLPSDADYEDENNLYKTIKLIVDGKVTTISMTYADKAMTLDEVRVYTTEYIANGSVYSLPASVESTLETYLKPVITRYTSTASIYMLIEKKLGSTINFEENSTDKNAYLAEYIEISKRSGDEYAEKETYANWWTTMYN